MAGDGLEDLVRRAREGDREAAGEILARYGDRVRFAIRGRLAPGLRRRFETDDVFQSAVGVSLEDLRGLRYEGEKALVAWLVKVAERRLLGVVRRHRAARRDVQREAPLAEAALLSADRTSPPRGAERAEVRSLVEAAVARLPGAERRVIELRSYEGRSFGEIAEEMGLTTKHAARDLFQKALRRMGELVEGGDREPEA